jgi:hypothetical protein
MMSLLWTTASVPTLLAESDFEDWQGLIYILLFLILPLLSSLGAWIRKRSGKDLENPEADLEDLSEDEIILIPEEVVRRSRVPQARPAEPAPPVIVAPPPAPPARPVARPAAPPAPVPIRPVLVPPPVSPREVRAPRLARRLRAEGHPDVMAVPVADEPEVRATRVELGPLTQKDLRRAIVLREVLGPPVALRPPGEASWER